MCLPPALYMDVCVQSGLCWTVCGWGESSLVSGFVWRRRRVGVCGGGILSRCPRLFGAEPLQQQLRGGAHTKFTRDHFTAAPGPQRRSSVPLWCEARLRSAPLGSARLGSARLHLHVEPLRGTLLRWDSGSLLSRVLQMLFKPGSRAHVPARSDDVTTALCSLGF